jgi:hypothetical protein
MKLFLLRRQGFITSSTNPTLSDETKSCGNEKKVMPRIDPTASFEVAARHLFRHFNDAALLRANPLLRRFFIETAVDSPGTVLNEVHAYAIAVTDELCTALESKGLARQAARRREIVAALCAGEEPVKTAARLRVSRSHYYRERHAVSVGIARALNGAATTHASRVVMSDDPLRLLFKRAETLRDAGFSRAAVDVLESAYGAVADASPKATVGLALAEELVFFGNHDRARALLAQSGGAHKDSEADASDWLRETQTLYRARLQSQLSRDSGGVFALETLAKRRIAERRSDDVTYDAVFLTGEGYRNAGRFGDAKRMLRRLQAMDGTYLRAIPKRQIGVLLLEAYCAEASDDELRLAEQSFRDALELSVASGTVVGALLAMAGLIAHDAARGRDEAAYTTARQALQMAKSVDFNGFLGFVMVEIVGAMLKTRYWRAIDPLVFEVERFAAPRALGRALLKQAQATFFMRMGRPKQAHQALSEGFALAKKLGNRRIEGLILRDRALALVDSKAGPERADLMREAVDLVERYGSFNDLTVTYDAAARVIGDRRSLQQARQLGAASLHGRAVRTSVRVEPLRL